MSELPTSDKRAQGRPVRGTDEVGRMKIVDAARIFMRSRNTQDLKRKDLAAFVGVTPALISYYFPQRTTLIEMATMPVLSAYSHRLQTIGQSSEPPSSRLKALVETLVDMNLHDARLIEFFESYVVTSHDYSGASYVDLMRHQVLSVVGAYINDKPDPPFDAACLAIVVWTLCKVVTEESLVRAPLPKNTADDVAVRHALAARVYAFLASGIGGSWPSQ